MVVEPSVAHRLYPSVRRGPAHFLTRKRKREKTGPSGVLQELAVQPGPCVSPVPISRCRRDAQGDGGLVQGQAGKIAQLDELTREVVQDRQALQRIVQGDQLVRG